MKQLLYETELLDYVNKKAKNIADLVSATLHAINDNTRQSTVIKTGFDDFDTQFGGCCLSEFTVAGGRPAMGKSQFLVNLSLNISVTVPVLYIALDISEYLLTSRFISSFSGIPVSNILQCNLSREQTCTLFLSAMHLLNTNSTPSFCCHLKAPLNFASFLRLPYPNLNN